MRLLGVAYCLLLAPLWGCSHHGNYHGSAPVPGRIQPEIRLTGREPLDLLLPSQSAVLPEVCAVEDGRPYLALTEREAQCLAAANVPIPALLQMENALSARADSGKCCSQGESGALQRRMRVFREMQLRNEAARDVLLAYYDLAEAEAARQSLCGSLDIINRTLHDLEQLAREGLLLDGSAEELRRRRLDLMQQQATLVVTIDGLNRTLYYQMGMGDRQPHPIWPDLNLNLVAAPLVAEAAVAVGLTERAELHILRTMRGNLNSDTLPVARGILQQNDPGLGSPPGKQSQLCRLLNLHNDDELATRAGQLHRLIIEQEEQISSEIQAAATSVEVRAQQVLLARTEVELAQQRVRDQKELQEVGRGTPLDVNQAELQLLETRQSQLVRFLAWKRARVNLAAAQGILALECGYSVHGGHCGVCP